MKEHEHPYWSSLKRDTTNDEALKRKQNPTASKEERGQYRKGARNAIIRELNGKVEDTKENDPPFYKKGFKEGAERISNKI